MPDLVQSLELIAFSERIIQLVLLALCLFVSWTDIRSRRIPNLTLLIGFLLVLVLRLLYGEGWTWTAELPLAAAVLLFFGMIALIWPAAVGMGDVKMLAFVAYGIGFTPFVHVLTVASLLAFLYSIYLILRQKANYTYTLPYAPFLSMGLVLWIFSTL
jgi:Flp pilus assembly protein protease CpaA